MKQNLQDIVVVGGTSFDSERGAVLLRKMGVTCKSIGLCGHPEEQSEMYLQQEKLQEHFYEKVGKHGFKHIVIFCNSLSFAGPWKEIYGNRITELTSEYTVLLKSVNLKKTAIIVAEENTVEQLGNLAANQGICESNELHVFARLELIKQLEKSNPHQQRELILTEISQLKNQGFSEIIFGCTHLDHPDFYQLDDVKIHQPGIQLLTKFYKRIIPHDLKTKK